MGFSRRLACKLVASNPTREHARSLHKKIKPLTGLFLFGANDVKGFSRRLACKLVASNPTREHARSLHKKLMPRWGIDFLALIIVGGFSRRLACKLVASNPTREHARSLHKKLMPRWGIDFLAERVGFEPTVDLRPRLISSQVHSTTLPPLLLGFMLLGFSRRPRL